tara:strand:- start:840 stop:1661 length:822 start_codon:yes stop_codon:yes gene_type:complete
LPPTYDTIDAGTFAHALSAESGAPRLVSDYKNDGIDQSPEDMAKAEKIIRGMGDATEEEHADACKQGGGSHSGMTAKEKDEHSDVSKANGGTHSGMTAKEKDEHSDAIKAGMRHIATKTVADLAQRAKVFGKHRQGSTVFKTVFVLEGGSSFEFFHFDTQGSVSLHIKVRPHHGRLYEVVAEGKDTAYVSLYIPPSSEIVPAGRTGILKQGYNLPFSHQKITLLSFNNISWETSKFPVTTEMVEAYDAELATKQKMQKAKMSKRKNGKRKRRR